MKFALILDKLSAKVLASVSAIHLQSIVNNPVLYIDVSSLLNETIVISSYFTHVFVAENIYFDAECFKVWNLFYKMSYVISYVYEKWKDVQKHLISLAELLISDRKVLPIIIGDLLGIGIDDTFRSENKRYRDTDTFARFAAVHRLPAE